MKENYIQFVEKREQFLKDRAILFEAFKNSDFEGATQKIESILKKHIEGLIPLVGMVDTVIDSQKCVSKQYIVVGNKEYSKCKMFQFNWLVSEKSSEIYSIDFFKDMNIYWDGAGKSDLTVYTLGTSIVKILPLIWDVVNNDNYSLTQDQAIKIIDKYNSKVKESKYNVGGLEYRILNGLKKNLITEAFSINSKEEKEEVDIESEIRVIKEDSENIELGIDSGKKVKINLDKSVTDAEKEFNTELHKDPEQVFKEMSKYISLVVKGIQPSLIICGAPGTGKTFRVKKQLKGSGYVEGENLCTIKGKCTTRRLYLALYEYKDKGDIVFIDDADSLVGPKADENSINILKAALDSDSDPAGRLVTYGIAGKILDDEGMEIPKKFYYKGGVIVNTNYRAGALDTALRGRSFIQDINFSQKEVLDLVKSLLPNIEPELFSPKVKLKAFNYLCELNEKGSKMELSLRTFVLCAKIFEACDNDDSFTDEDAKSMIEEQMKLQYERNRSKY